MKKRITIFVEFSWNNKYYRVGIDEINEITIYEDCNNTDEGTFSTVKLRNVGQKT